MSDFAANVASTQSVLAHLERHSPRTRFVFLSSAAVYGNPKRVPIVETSARQPISPYGAHKAAGEMLCRYYARAHQIPTLSLRLFSTYGRGLRRQVLWDMCQAWRRTGDVALSGTGCETRDLLHVTDVVRAISLTIDRGRFDGTCINVASGIAVTIATLAGMVLARLGSGTTVFSGAARRGDPKHWQANVGRLSRLGFEPTIGLDEGIADYVDWARHEDA